jgi:hypothetical protein
MEETQKVPCPSCGLPVPMPLAWDGSHPEEALCNFCYEAFEKIEPIQTKPSLGCTDGCLGAVNEIPPLK